MNDRAIDLSKARIEQTDPTRVWLKVGKFDILINHTDEGVVVDIWPWVEEDAPEVSPWALATCYAFDSDAEQALGASE